MKKIICLILSLIVCISVFGCTSSDEKTIYVPPTGLFDETPSPDSDDTEGEIPVATVGYYNGEEKVSVLKNYEYVNLFNTRTYYITPGVLYILPFEGNANDWEVSEDPYDIIKDSELYVEGDKLMIKTADAGVVVSSVSGKITQVKTGCGYIYFKNKSTDEIAKLYVNLKVEQQDENKQTNKDLPYYLYFEKGNYKTFSDGDCCLTVYTVDADGYYTVPYLTFSSACGRTSDLTPTGYHTIGSDNVGSLSESTLRERWHDWGGSQYGQFATTYTDGRFMHGPTTSTGKEENHILSGSYNEIGSHASGGCLRMQTGAAYWIYTHCPDGTTLEIRANNPRGTHIERPAPMLYNGYDPTDPYLINYDLE